MTKYQILNTKKGVLVLYVVDNEGQIREYITRLCDMFTH